MEDIKEIVEAEAAVAEVVAVEAAEMAIGFALTRGKSFLFLVFNFFFFFYQVFYFFCLF